MTESKKEKKLTLNNVATVMVFISIALFIVCGNAITINFGNRLPLKIAEIFSVISVFLVLLNVKRDYKFLIGKKIIVWLVIGIITALINEIIYRYSVKNLAYAMLYPARIFYLLFLVNTYINQFKKNSIKFETVVNFMIGSFIVVCVLGIIQLIVIPNALDLYNALYKFGMYIPNPDPHVSRLLSTYLDPNYLAAILIIPFAFSYVYWIKTHKKIYLFDIAIITVTICLTTSRSGFVGFLLAFVILTIIYLFKRNENNKIRFNIDKELILSIILVILLVYAGNKLSTYIFNRGRTPVAPIDDPENVVVVDPTPTIERRNVFTRIIGSLTDESTFLRFQNWFKGFDIVKDNPVIGIGYNLSGAYAETQKNQELLLSTAYGLDSSILLVAGTTGVVGLTYFVYAMLVTLLRCIRGIKNKNHEQSALFTIILISLMVCNFNNLLFYVLWLVPILTLYYYYYQSKDERRIAVDARMINMSGIGTYLKRLVTHDHYSVAMGNVEELNEFKDNLDTIIKFEPKIYGIDEQLKFPYVSLYKEGVDLLHVPHYNVPLLYSGEMVATVHDITHLKLPEYLPNKFAKYYAKFMISAALHKSKKVIAVSENTKKDLVEMFKINPDKIEVIYNSISEEFKEKDPETYSYLYEKYNIPKNKKVLLYVGNLKPHKNLESLLEAYSKMKTKDDCILLLVGKAFEKYNVLEDREKKLNIDKNVIHTGMVTDEELVDLYNLADLFVFPTLYEGFGLPVLEAMSCGTKVVCSDNSSLPEVGGELVTYFNAKDIDQMVEKIEEALNKELTQEDKDKMREWVHKFDYENTEKQILDILK